MGQFNPDRHIDNMLVHFSCFVLLASSAVASPRPDDGYGAPEPVYEEPETGYGPPDDGYGAPAAGYGPPSYAAETGLDLTTLIIPLLPSSASSSSSPPTSHSPLSGGSGMLTRNPQRQSWSSGCKICTWQSLSLRSALRGLLVKLAVLHGMQVSTRTL